MATPTNSSLFQDALEEDASSQRYVYSSDNLCWVLRNGSPPAYYSSYMREPTYCHYGLAVVIPVSAVLVVSMVLAIVGNSMVIVTIARHRGMRTRTNLLLANLAVADILVAVLDMPIALITIINGDWIFSHLFCDLNGFAVGLGLMISTHTLMWISIHKFISITRPFSRSVTPGKIILMILAAWSWAILYNLTPTTLISLTDTEYKLGASQCGPAIPRLPKQYIHSGINTIFNLVGPFTIMAYCYYRIFKEVKDHLKRMRDFADVSACNSLIEQKQITETLCIVLSVFVLFWLPYIVYSLSLVSLRKKYVPVIFNPIAYMFGYMNSACNPIIYALRSPSFRRGFSEIIFGNNRQRFSGSVYGREHSTGNFGRMIVSFRRPLFGNEDTGKSNVHGNRKGSLMSSQQAAKKITLVSRVGKNSLADVSFKQVSPHMGEKYSHKDTESRSKKMIYKNVKNNVNVEISKGISVMCKKESENPCHGTCVCEKAVSHTNASDQQVKAIQSMCLEKDPTNNRGKEANASPVIIESFVYPRLEKEVPRERHASFNQQAIKLCNHNNKASASQSDIAVLPSQNLDICIDGTRISSSNREIMITTLEIRDNQIRSVSVGDVRVTCSTPSEANNSPVCSPSSSGAIAQDSFVSKDISQQLLKRKYPVVWQPSVGNIFDSPVISRRKFHMRRTPIDSGEIGNCNTCKNMHKDKLSSLSAGNRKNLGVASLITSVKKSLTDLFNLDVDDHLKSEIQVSSFSKIRDGSLEDDGGGGAPAAPDSSEHDGAAAVSSEQDSTCSLDVNCAGVDAHNLNSLEDNLKKLSDSAYKELCEGESDMFESCNTDGDLEGAHDVNSSGYV